MRHITFKTYYSLLIDFNAPTNARVRQYTMSDTEIKDYYDGKIVPHYYDQLAKLFRRYGSYHELVKNLDKLQILQYNEPGVRIAILAINQQLIQNLLNGNLKV